MYRMQASMLNLNVKKRRKTTPTSPLLGEQEVNSYYYYINTEMYEAQLRIFRAPYNFPKPLVPVWGAMQSHRLVTNEGGGLKVFPVLLSVHL